MIGRIDTERAQNGVATLWLDNAAHLNALSDGMIVALREHLIALGEDKDCRAVVLRGRGNVFCAGRELTDVKALQSADLEGVTAIYETHRLLHDAIHYCPHPVIAVIERYAFGAGLMVASWCDIAIAEDGAKMGFPDVHHGIAPSTAIPELVRGIPRKAAVELFFTARRITAAEAARIGLITRAVPKDELEEEVAGVCADICKGAPGAIARAKQFIWQTEDADLKSAMHAAVDSVSLGIVSPETRRRIEAFLSKDKRAK